MDVHGARLSLTIRMLPPAYAAAVRRGRFGKYSFAHDASADLRADGRLGRSSGGERRTDQGRKGLRAGLAHDRRTMVVDRALADAEVGSDVLARMAGNHQVQDLSLTHGQAGDSQRGRLSTSLKTGVVGLE